MTVHGLGRSTALGIGAALAVAPIGVMFAASVAPSAAIAAGGSSRAGLTLTNYRTVFSSVDLGRCFINSVVVSFGTVILQILVCLPAAYVLARRSFRGRRGIRLTLAALVMIPFQVVVVPLYVLFERAGLLDTWTALIVPFIGSPLAIWLLAQHIASLRHEVFDSAHLDGASHLATLCHVVVPASRPALLALGAYTGATAWNSYFWPSFVLAGSQSPRATVPFAVMSFANSEAGSAYGPQMAMATLAVLPVLILFLSTHRYMLGDCR